jgi:hypothetical protein
MKKYLLATAALMTLSTPAYAAGEGYVEGRIGYAWVGDLADTESLGVALGYDFDVGGNAFVGIEATADTDFDINNPILGLNARLGVKAGEKSKIFGTIGYVYDTTFEVDDMLVGAGFEQKVGKVSLGLQYQRVLDLEVNRLFVGIGTKF